MLLSGYRREYLEELQSVLKTENSEAFEQAPFFEYLKRHSAEKDNDLMTKQARLSNEVSSVKKVPKY